MEGIRYRGVFGTISTMIRTEGPRSLYNGLVAGLQRQLCFASIRIGLYDNVKNFYTGGKDSECLAEFTKVEIGGFLIGENAAWHSGVGVG